MCISVQLLQIDNIFHSALEKSITKIFTDTILFYHGDFFNVKMPDVKLFWSICSQGWKIINFILHIESLKYLQLWSVILYNYSKFSKIALPRVDSTFCNPYFNQVHKMGSRINWISIEIYVYEKERIWSLCPGDNSHLLSYCSMKHTSRGCHTIFNKW